MKIEFIYTFEQGAQEFATLPFVLPIMEDMNTLIEFATEDCHRLHNLVKISCCVLGGEINLPEWYDECSGKIWADDLDIYRKDRHIPTSVSKHFFEEFGYEEYLKTNPNLIP